MALKNKCGHTHMEIKKNSLEKCEKFGKYLVGTDRNFIAKAEKQLPFWTIQNATLN